MEEPSIREAFDLPEPEKIPEVEKAAQSATEMWVQSSKRKTKPFAEYKSVKAIEDEIGRPLTEQEATSIITQMEQIAEEAPEVDFTPENWLAMFGEDGIVNTPIGNVKMGENQFGKLALKKRTSYFGMIKPTLNEPHVIIEKNASAEGAERDTKYLFVRTFKKPNGGRIVHFESITVQRDGMEVSISSHEAESKYIKKDMQNEKILHISKKLSLGSDESLTEAPGDPKGPDLVPTSDNAVEPIEVSERKVSTLSPDKQVTDAESSESQLLGKNVEEGKDVADVVRTDPESGERRYSLSSYKESGRRNGSRKHESTGERKEREAVYDMAKGLLEETGVETIEVDNATAQRMLGNRNGNELLMGSRTDRKMARIADAYADSELDENQRKVVDVFSGKADNQSIEVERADGSVRIVMRQGDENKAGTKHSLYRHFETSRNHIMAEDIVMIPDVLAKGERRVIGNKVSYDLEAEDGSRMRVTTAEHGNVEVFTNFYTNRKTSEVESSSVANNAVVTRHHSGAQSFNPEVKDAKLAKNAETDKTGGEKPKFSIQTYHGTHDDFEEFDHSHMGEGEGNQAFGWGTYVTENEGIGKYYAEGISASRGEERLSVRGEVVNFEGLTNPWRLIRDLSIDCNGRLKEMRERAERYAAYAEPDSPMCEVWPKV